ncbi:amidase [Xylariales sp. AK1849]|nr:amidase [Xylariales sp. AK1849]
MAAAGKSWQDLKAAKQVEQDSRIPQEWKLKKEDFPPESTTDLRSVVETCGILSRKELEITGVGYDATSLAAAVADGKYTAVEVTTAFCKRAAVGHQLFNMLTEIMFSDAIEQAKKLDDTFKSTGRVVGPLHGVPMTFKECFHFKGYDSTNGYVSRVFQPATTTSPLAQIVQAAGAVVISKTNVPQSMLIAESDNNVFGQTRNPVNCNLTCGGSSGGEGSAQAYRASALGIGTDVGGSIRIPAAANGIYGYKPTYGIIPMIGYSYSGYTGTNTGILAVSGPMNAEPRRFDPAVIPAIMEIKTATRKPIVGVIYESGVRPHPPIARAMKEAVATLRVTGFEIRDFNPPDFRGFREASEQLFTLDALSYAKHELAKAGEPVVPSMRPIGFWDIPAKTQEETGVGCDVVLAPAGPHTAVKPGHWTNDIYTVVWNSVDYPAIIVPVGQVDPTKDLKDLEFKALHDADAKNEEMYEPELVRGAPVALQIVGPRLGDAQLLKDAEVIDGVLNGSK